MSQVAIMPGRPTVVAQTPSDMMEALRNHGWLQDKKENTSPLMGCIGPMLEAIEWGGDLRQLCDALPYAYERFGLLDFLNVMAALGYKNAAIKSNIREVDGALVPALFIPQDDGAPLVLSEITREGIVVINGDGGKRENWQAKNLKGTLYIFTPIQKESQAEMQARTRVGRTWFRERIERFLPMLWPVLILGVVISFVTLSVPLFVMMVYDKVINAQSLPTLKYFVIGAAIAIGAEIMLRYLRVHALAWFGARLNNIISVGIFERLLYLPPSVTEGVSIASQLARIKAFEQVRDFFTGTMFALILETPFVFVMMLGIWWVAGPLVCISVFITGCYIALLFAMHRKFKMLSFRHAKAGSDKQKIVVEMFSKLPVIKYNGMVESWRDRYRQISVDYSLSGFRSTFTAAVVEHVAYALMLIAVVATITLGIERIWAGAMTAGALVATMILTWRVLSPLQSLCAVLPRMEQVRQSIAQLNELMRLQPEREPYGTVHALRPFRGHIAFLNVSLRYGRKFDPVFMNLNLEAKPGDLITIMGLNGVGKTSIIKIAAGLYGVTTGTIRLDGIDIRQLDPVQLRRHVTYIGQSPDVFSGTVMDNLRLTAPLATETEIKAALEKAGAWEEVQAMVDGIRTEIHLNDINLSSSLIYKLNLARAYLSTASIILCDELPYAILNSKTGEEFKKFLESQKGKRTVMLVTHREDYVALADKVVVLKQDKRPIVTTPAQLFKKTNLLKGVTHGTQAKL